MLQLEMVGLLLICIFISLHLIVANAKLFPCNRKQIGSTCYVQNITIGPEDSHVSVMFEEARRLVIEYSNIRTFSEALFHNIPDVESITLKGLESLGIAPEPNHSLNTLLINRNFIKNLPKSIRHLRALSILDLSQNQIEYVNLDWFQQMENLLVLDLSWNRIAQMDASSDLRLGRLKNFFVSYNNLGQIPWFPIGFPKLERIRLSDNYWSCAWVASMRKQIWDRRIRLFDSDSACSENSEGGLCCYDQVPIEVPSRYELIEIEFQEQADGVASSEPPGMMMSDQASRDEGTTCGDLRERVRSLKREKLTLVKEKAEMAQQYAKKVASMQEALRSVREDLETAEKEVTRYRYKERMDMIERTKRIDEDTIVTRVV
ncbi:phospholipase A2 inhibitor-like isoform X2 [Armigeres subalbatus]|uniref:phospholipase A2 inhibitor-like isoform X2 n=1 Tax=Armigeres subalbatus TaxID=124917 RepID=UPI002ED167CC